MVVVCTDRVRFEGNRASGKILMILFSVLSASVPVGVVDAETRREARGWLELERDQQTYRERVEPLDLRDQRGLETIERSQRNDLRALQQRQRRALEAERRSNRLGQSVDLPRQMPNQIPRRDSFLQQRQTVERKRLQIRMQQDRLPYGN
jgi:hypothetical protein